jgi:hypothetical protein
MSTTPIYRERISRFSPGIYLTYASGWVMRIWREEKLDNESYSPGRTQIDRDVAATIQKFISTPATPLDLCRAILEIERVNAVECIDFAGFGEVLYKDWP